MGAGAGGDDAGQSRLADPRRAMQDQVPDPIGADRSAQQSPRAEDLLLALELLDRARPQPIGQRRQAATQLLAAVAEEIAQRHDATKPII